MGSEMRRQGTLLTKAQVQEYFKSIKVDEKVPLKGKKVVIAFPGHEGNLSEVIWSDKTSDSGDRLYLLEQSSAAGRAFDDTVQEAHVITRSNAIAKKIRVVNMARNALLACPEVEILALDIPHAPLVINLMARNQAHFEKGYLGHLPWNEDSYTRWLCRETDLVLGMFDGERCVGIAGANIIRLSGSTQLALGIWYGLDKDYCGRGLATRAVLEVVKHCHEKFPDLETAVIHCHNTNKKSMAVASRLGFDHVEAASYEKQLSARSCVKMIGHTQKISALIKAMGLFDNLVDNHRRKYHSRLSP